VSVHDRDEPAAKPICCAVLTISDTRTLANDASGSAISELLEEAGCRVVERQVVPDDPAAVRTCLRTWAGRPELTILITTGGTGIARRDATYEAVVGLIERPLPGFGELFRWLSYQEIGPAAMLTRATAGVIGRVAVFALPGSEHAVRLAMRRLIIPELPHLSRELIKDR
jgi:molybdenum cofactor biosynthesis protein B